MANKIQLRRDTAASWTSANPILAQGELGIETDGLNTTEVKRKIGDGVTAWNSLAYDHSAASVTSVAGKTGAVVLDSNDVGLDQVDNTSDVNKPISDTQQTEFDLKVDKVAGKELSENDYTDDDASKLSNVSLDNIEYPKVRAKQHISPEPKEKLLLSNFDEALGALPDEWELGASGSAISNTIPTDSFAGFGSIKLTAVVDDPAATIKKTLSSTIDLSTKRVVRLRSKLSNVGAFDNTGNGLVIRLYSSPTDYVDINVTRRMYWNSQNSDNFCYVEASFATGVTNNITTVGTPNFSAINAIEIQLLSRTGIGSPPNATFDQIVFYESELEKAQIVFQWDDGNASLVDNELPTMSKYGLIGEVGFIGSKLDGSDPTKEWYEYAQKHGWSIANHGGAPSGWASATSLEELKTDFFSCVDVMQANGLYNWDTFIYPEGKSYQEYNAINDLISNYCLCSRYTGDNDAYTNQWPTAEPYLLRSMNLRNTTSIAQATAAIDEAVAEKSLLVFYCHALTAGAAGGTTWNQADFETLAAYARSKIDAGTATNTTTGNLFRGV